MDPVVIWRTANAVLAVTAFILVGVNMIRYWSVRKGRMRLMSMALLALLFASAEGSIETAVQQSPAGPRTVLTTAACLWVIVAMVMTPHDYTDREAEYDQEHQHQA